MDHRTKGQEQQDSKTRKGMTVHGTFYPKSDVHRLYLHRKLGGRGLISCEGCVRTEGKNLGWCLKIV